MLSYILHGDTIKVVCMADLHLILFEHVVTRAGPVPQVAWHHQHAVILLHSRTVNCVCPADLHWMLLWPPESYSGMSWSYSQRHAGIISMLSYDRMATATMLLYVHSRSAFRIGLHCKDWYIFLWNGIDQTCLDRVSLTLRVALLLRRHCCLFLLLLMLHGLNLIWAAPISDEGERCSVESSKKR